MSLFTCNFFSKILMTPTRVNVCLPSPGSSETLTQSLDMLYAKREPLRALYLLHGMNGDESAWLRKTNVERYAQRHNLALIMPHGENGFYIDMVHGAQWFTYLTEELPRFIGASFPVSSRREDTYIAGLSMGGYGAFKAAMTYPQRYAAFGSFSGALDIEAVAAAAKGQGLERQAQDVFGGKPIAGSENDLFALTGRAMASGNKLPRAYLSCGDADEACYSMNLKMRSFLLERSYPLTWCKVPGGRHDWDVWEAQIQRFLDWLDQ